MNLKELLQQIPLKKLFFLMVGVGIFFLVGVLFLESNIGVPEATTTVNQTQTNCQSLCQQVISIGMNFNTCSELSATQKAQNFAKNCAGSVSCVIPIRGGEYCEI